MCVFIHGMCVFIHGMCASPASGSMDPPKGEIPQRWGYIADKENHGRFTVFAARSRLPPKGDTEVHGRGHSLFTHLTIGISRSTAYCFWCFNYHLLLLTGSHDSSRIARQLQTTQHVLLT